MFGPPLNREVADLIEAYLESASRAEGYVEFGPLDFIEPLNVILGDLSHRANLTAFGRLLARYFLQQILRMRLKIQHGTAQVEGIERPVFILGLPRTGTTLLHELLSQHPDLRAPTFHESHHYPHNNWRDHAANALTHTQLFFVDKLAPTFKRVHELKAHGPHECVSIQGYAFRSMHFHVAFRLPQYNEWMMSEFDWGPAYTLHHQYLSQLSRLANTSERWVLKAPGHMLGLGALLNRYPDALFIQTHRDPIEVIPSMASLTLSLRGMASRDINLSEIGADVNGLWHKGINNTLALRQSDPDIDRRFLDLRYTELTGNSLNTMERIAKFVGIEWTDSYKENLASFLTANPHQKHGAHRYSLDQFHLDKDVLNTMYEEYRLAHLHG